MSTQLDAGPAASIDAPLAKSRDRLLHDLTGAVGSAFAEIAAAARDTLDEARQQFELETAALRGQLSDALEDLERQHAETSRLVNELASERAARDSATALYAALELEHEQVVATHTEQIRALEAQLEAARSAGVRMATELESAHAQQRLVQGVLDSIRSALSNGTVQIPVQSPLPAPLPPPPSLNAPAPVAAVVSEAVPVHKAEPPQNEVSVAHPPEWREYACQLLEQIESAYQHDVDTSERPSDVVDHLTEYLRIARDMFSTRFIDAAEAPQEFDRQVTAVLDAKGTTPFGRHLAIAWYVVGRPAGSEAA
jgi:hypothetical protein